MFQIRIRDFSAVRHLVVILVVSYMHTVHGAFSAVNTFLWTWIGISNSTGSAVNYDVQGVPNSSNVPPAQHGAASWTGVDVVLWLVGGRVPSGVVDNLWYYNLSA